MKIRYALLSLVLLTTQLYAQGVSFNEESVDLDALYQEIDEAMTQLPHYVAERERKIAVCRDSLQNEDNLEKRVKTAEQLFLLYKPYRNDSAQYYAELCIGFSETMNLGTRQAGACGLLQRLDACLWRVGIFYPAPRHAPVLFGSTEHLPRLCDDGCRRG